MEPATAPCRSHLFLAPIWAPAGAGDAPVSRGKFQAVLSGATYCFGDWAALIALLVRLVDQPARPAARAAENAGE